MFKKINIAKENELEDMLIKDPDSLEQGLKILTHQRRANGKFIDVLGVAADGVLVVIELKIDQDDEMLLQALEYYDYVSANRDRFANEYLKDPKIDPEENPRIILVASGFSDRLRKAARFFEAEIELREYSYLETKSGERNLYFTEIPFDSEYVYKPEKSLESVVEYINQAEVKKLCFKVHGEIMKLGDVETVPRPNEIRYKCKNHRVGAITLRKKFFYVWWQHPNTDDFSSVTITKGGDWSKQREKVLNGFEKRYRTVGGE